MRTDAVEVLANALATAARPIEVLGDSEAAGRLRELVGDAMPGTEHPATIVEMTGNPEAFATALERVADLGTVVLAGQPPSGSVAVDLHDELHVRGITVIGVDPDEPHAIEPI